MEAINSQDNNLEAACEKMQLSSTEVSVIGAFWIKSDILPVHFFLKI